jgi:hypothetical protein
MLEVFTVERWSSVTLDAVSLEHLFADLLGTKGRGGPSDADAVRGDDQRHLVEALAQAASALKKASRETSVIGRYEYLG